MLIRLRNIHPAVCPNLRNCVFSWKRGVTKMYRDVLLVFSDLHPGALPYSSPSPCVEAQ